MNHTTENATNHLQEQINLNLEKTEQIGMTPNPDFNLFDLSSFSTMPFAEFGGNLLYLDRWGLRPDPQEDSDLLPNPASVALAQEWLRYVITAGLISVGATMNMRYNSYELKGAVERFGSENIEELDTLKIGYIGNGDFITAMLTHQDILIIPDVFGAGTPRNAFFSLDLPVSLEDRTRAYMTEPLLLGPDNEPYIGTPEQKNRFADRYGA